MGHPSFNATKKLLLYSHGFVEDVDFLTVRTIVDAYIQNGNYNILVIDWRDLAFNLIYPIVASSLEQVKRYTEASRGVNHCNKFVPISIGLTHKMHKWFPYRV